jgi:hypothetical protein
MTWSWCCYDYGIQGHCWNTLYSIENFRSLLACTAKAGTEVSVGTHYNNGENVIVGSQQWHWIPLLPVFSFWARVFWVHSCFELCLSKMLLPIIQHKEDCGISVYCKEYSFLMCVTHIVFSLPPECVEKNGYVEGFQCVYTCMHLFVHLCAHVR